MARKLKKLETKEAAAMVKGLRGWKIERGELTRTFEFADYYEAVAFVNATAWMSNRVNHHPDIELGYNKVKMRYSTHSVGGLSEIDFLCADAMGGLVDG